LQESIFAFPSTGPYFSIALHEGFQIWKKKQVYNATYHLSNACFPSVVLWQYSKALASHSAMKGFVSHRLALWVWMDDIVGPSHYMSRLNEIFVRRPSENSCQVRAATSSSSNFEFEKT
jgi:hypothetical protein